jgi:hypothetical protein
MLSHINSSMNHGVARKQLKVPLLFLRAWRPTTILSYMFMVGRPVASQTLPKRIELFLCSYENHSI